MSRVILCYPLRRIVALLVWLLVTGCSQNRERPTDAAPLGTGHFEGTATLSDKPGQSFKLTLDLRHPRPGHYDAEVLAPDLPSLSFVADTADFRPPTLHLTRPGRPGQHLILTRDGDFWRGTLVLDSVQAPVLLLRRGAPSPMVYRVEEVAQIGGKAWLFAPADVGTPSAALVLLPDSATAAAGALWADALARAGLTVLLLPSADTVSPAATAALLLTTRQLLRDTPGTDSTNLGIWAAGVRADAVAQALVADGGPQTAFFLAQNSLLSGESRAAYRTLARRKLPVLGLYGGPGTKASAAALRGAWRGRAVRSYRAGPDLLVPGPVGRMFGPGLPNEVVGWLPRPQ
jgi:hypothetical protein